MSNYSKLTKTDQEDDEYEIVEEELFDEEIGQYISYGIRNKNSGIYCRDVSCDFKFVLNLVELLNSGKIFEVHFLDIIQDALE